MIWHPPRMMQLCWGWGGALGPAQGGGHQWKPRGLSWRVPSPATFQGLWEGTPGLRTLWGSGRGGGVRVCISWGRHGGPHSGSRTPSTPAPLPQDEKDQLNEYRGHLSGLAKRAKAIVQLTPRNPTQPTRGRVPLLAVCDYKQVEVRAWPGGRGHGGGWAWPHSDGSGCCRRRCTRAMSARCWAPHSRSTGRCSAALAVRLPCPPCASLCPRRTRRPWRLWPGAWSWAGRPAGW